MPRSISRQQMTGLIFTVILGTILHFLFEWTGGSVLVSPFSGVNESTWEHMKLLYWPLLFFALVQRVFFMDQKNYWCVKLTEILLGLILVPVLFYTYNGAFGKSPDWVNITIFYISALIVYLYERRAFRKNRMVCPYPWLAFAGICLIGVLFVVFTFAPPGIPLFRDPLADA